MMRVHEASTTPKHRFLFPLCLFLCVAAHTQGENSPSPLPSIVCSVNLRCQIMEQNGVVQCYSEAMCSNSLLYSRHLLLIAVHI